MVDKVHFSKLKEGVESWNNWIESCPDGFIPDLVGANLSGMDLSGANLIRSDLSGANLCRAHLVGTYLSGARLRNANLDSAQLRGAYLRSTNLSLANLSSANLTGTDLIEADLSGAVLHNTNLQNAYLIDADMRCAELFETIFAGTCLSNVLGLETVVHRGPSVVDHRTIEKSSPSLPNYFLTGCQLPDLLIDYFPSLLAKPIQFYSCFISYSHEDKAFAQHLHDHLQAKGIRCWLDNHRLLPGDDILDKIDTGIKLWDRVLLVCSESSLSSDWVSLEIEKALEKERTLMENDGEKFLALIPLNIDDFLFSEKWKSRSDQSSTIELQNRLAADFTNWNSNDEKFSQSLELIIRALQLKR